MSDAAPVPAIEVTGLVKRFNGVAAVDGVTFTVPPGEIFGFLGPNGAGKTTTIRMLAALLEPDGGEARIAGHSVWDAPEQVRAAIGFMPDDFGVYPGLRVDEYLDFFAAASRMPRAVRPGVLEAVLELTGLDAIRSKRVETLSRGMRQRLGLGRALVHEPQVLLLDEPASGLDPRARIEMRELLHELARMGKTILVSSHILTEMSELCTTIGIIERGRLLAAGTPAEILKAMTPARRIRITLLDRRDEAAELLRGITGVSDAEVIDHELRVVFDGEEAEIVRLLKPLTDGGFPVTAVVPESADLERIFLRVTKGELA
jgi:ABC-2 type transport system ATP-binding protein